MPALSLVGPSYNLRSNKVDCERTVNYVPVVVESGNGKGGVQGYLKQIPGLVSLVALGSELRGLCVARDVLYAVAGGTLYEVSSGYTLTPRATLLSASGRVSMAANDTQIAVVDGLNLVVYDLDTHTVTTNPANWLGSNVVDVLDGYGIFAAPGGNRFQLTAGDDFTVIDTLDTEAAMGSIGKLVGLIVKHRELVLLKDKTGEVWYDAGGADFPLSRNDGANIEIGLAAPHSLCKKGGVAFWVGRDETGSAAVFQMAAYTPQRISTHALEEQLEAIGDMSGATAFTYSQEGLSYYVLQVPGLETTWVFEMSSNLWHERTELVNGAYQPWRAQFHAFAYGAHIVGGADGRLYCLDPNVNNNAGGELVRDRITPHFASPTMTRQRVGSIQIDGDVGQGLPSGQQASLLLRYSDDGGRTWGNWRTLTLGNIGQYKARARATMLGSARDRVWHFRVTDDVAFNMLSAVVNEL
jgi:hypothetical protein